MAINRADSTTTTQATFIESYIDNLSTLPNEIRRHFELMRELDKEGAHVQKELEESERKLAAEMKRKGSRQTEGMFDGALLEVAAKRQKAKQMADEKVQIAEQASADVDIHLDRLDAELSAFEHFLKTSGEFLKTHGANVGDPVACRPQNQSSDPDASGEGEREWILARVQSYDILTGLYTVSDEDDASKQYTVEEGLTVVLEGERIAKGEQVFAVYPDTTSFYPAVVTSVPRKSAGSVAATGPAAAALVCTVQFVDDVDESLGPGITPDRQVPLRHLFRRPHAADTDNNGDASP